MPISFWPKMQALPGISESPEVQKPDLRAAHFFSHQGEVQTFFSCPRVTILLNVTVNHRTAVTRVGSFKQGRRSVRGGDLLHEIRKPWETIRQHALPVVVLFAGLRVFYEGDRQGSFSAAAVLPDGFPNLLPPLFRKILCMATSICHWQTTIHDIQAMQSVGVQGYSISNLQ